MIQLTTSAAQTLAPGQALTFDVTELRSGCAEAHRAGSSIVTLRANCGTYEVTFGGNVTASAASPVQLSIELDGEPLASGTMASEVTTANVANAVSRTVAIRPGCGGCCGRVTVVNTGTTAVIVSAGATILVRRVA